MDIQSKDGSIHVTDERINTITSLVGSMVSLLLGVIIIEKSLRLNGAWYQLVAVVVYVLGLINLFVMSTLHHGLKASEKVEKVFRTLDYTAIFWLIAGTMTVLVAYVFQSRYGLAVLIGTWALAGTGIALRASITHLPKHITNTLFITLGWLPAMALLVKAVDMSLANLALLAAGGLIYSIGFVVYVSEKPNPIKGVFGFHEIWHILVVVASTMHALLVYRVIQ